MKVLLSFAFCVLACMSASAATPGSLDPTFGIAGIVATPVQYDASAESVLVQSDRKILVVGSSWNSITGAVSPMVLRYNANGILDATFGNGGTVLTPFGIGSNFTSRNSGALQADGKIVVLFSPWNGSNFDAGVLRYNLDGTLDITFGTGGKVSTPIGGGDDQAVSMVIQADGKIVVAGYTYNGANYDVALLRYTVSGVLDTGFGNGGRVVIPVGAGDDKAYSVVLQADGKIVIVGVTAVGIQNEFLLLRINIDGSVDNAFGNGGRVVTPIGSSNDRAYGVVVQPNGQILVAGITYNGSADDYALCRYNGNGSLDAAFGNAGKVMILAGNKTFYKPSLILQPDGKILFAGSTYNGTNNDFALLRYNNNGSIDSKFGVGGKVVTSIGSGDDAPEAIGLQPDGKIIAAGWTERATGLSSDVALVRYQNPLNGGNINLSILMLLLD